MRKIELKTIGFDPSEAPETTKLSYINQLEAIARYAPNGSRLDDMLQLVDLYQAISKAKKDDAGYLLIEESDYTLLQNKIKQFPFPAFSMTFLAFCNDINNAPKVETKLDKASATK